jgi:hypothetical protein
VFAAPVVDDALVPPVPGAWPLFVELVCPAPEVGAAGVFGDAGGGDGFVWFCAVEPSLFVLSFFAVVLSDDSDVLIAVEPFNVFGALKLGVGGFAR